MKHSYVFFIMLLSFNLSFAASQSGLPDNQCFIQAGKIQGQYEKAEERATIGEITLHNTCKLNTCSGDYEVAVVKSFSSFDWHNAPGWAIKEAQEFDFGDGDLVYVDTTTGYYTTICGDGERVAYSNWKQWVNSGTFQVTNNVQCSVNLTTDMIEFCGETFNFGTEHYCTYRYFDDSLVQGDSCDPGSLPTENDHFQELTDRYGVVPE